MRVAFKNYCLNPEGEFYLIGYGPKYESRLHPAKGIHDDIYARTMMLEVDGRYIFLFNADFIEFEEVFSNEIKEDLANRYAAEKNLIFLSATHNHQSVMSYHKHWNTGKFSQEYYDFLKNTIFNAYRECKEALEECEAYVGKGMCTGYYGSRVYYGELADNEIQLIEFKKGDLVLGAICNWATHSTVLSPNNDLLTGDFAGNVCRKLYEKKGYYPLMIVGAAGDCSNRAYRQGTDYEELERVSEGCAVQIARIKVNKKLDIHFEKDEIIYHHIQYKAQDHQELCTLKLKELQKEYEKADTFDEQKLIYDKMQSYRRKMTISDVDVTLSSTIIKLHDLTIVSIPGELGSALGIEIKQKSSSACCIICGYTNGHYSYILQPEIYKDSMKAIASKYRPEDVRAYIDKIEKVL